MTHVARSAPEPEKGRIASAEALFSVRHRVRAVWGAYGVRGLLSAVWRRLLSPHAACWQVLRSELAGKRGFEIGGPSSVFARGGLIPVYEVVAGVDNCDFSSLTTVGEIREGRHFVFDGRRDAGLQLVRDAVDLAAIPDRRYDFLLASHVLEHIANPLRALEEWARVLCDGGLMVLVVPHKDGTFDHRRPITTLQHLIDDYRSGVGEDDLTHLAETLELHDFGRDPKLQDVEEFRRRCTNNLEHRWLHHHVFGTRLVGEVIDQAGLEVLALEALRPHHIVAVARKLSEGGGPDNKAHLSDAAGYRASSPFPSDRGPQ
jgi:SAM-dependent methyltransferase